MGYSGLRVLLERLEAAAGSNEPVGEPVQDAPIDPTEPVKLDSVSKGKLIAFMALVRHVLASADVPEDLTGQLKLGLDRFERAAKQGQLPAAAYAGILTAPDAFGQAFRTLLRGQLAQRKVRIPATYIDFMADLYAYMVYFTQYGVKRTKEPSNEFLRKLAIRIAPVLAKIGAALQNDMQSRNAKIMPLRRELFHAVRLLRGSLQELIPSLADPRGIGAQ